MTEKIKIVKVKTYTKDFYGMHEEDWYVTGLDEKGDTHEGWASEFEILNSAFPDGHWMKKP